MASKTIATTRVRLSNGKIVRMDLHDLLCHIIFHYSGKVILEKHTGHPIKLKKFKP